jgi:hypothetical protein
VQSCFRNPILVPGIQGISQPVLAPIAELFAEAQQPIVEQALRQYVFDKQILGEMKRLNFNQSYWSDTNELVCVNLTAVQGSWGWAQVKFISSAAAGGACSVDNVAGENADLPASSFLQVTYDGSNFSVNTVTSGGDTSSDAAPIGGSVLAFPLENPWKPGLCLGASEPISVASGYYTFPTDGLLEMFVSWNSGQGSVGWADTRDPAGNVVGACSVNNNNAASVQQYIPFATYTIPVLANTQYSFATQSSSGAPSFHPFFLPFTNGLAFGTACAVQAGVTQYAQTDGLLVGVMMYPPPTVNTKLVASLSLVSAPVYQCLRRRKRFRRHCDTARSGSRILQGDPERAGDVERS